ncbi:hypothetical protein B0T14DRAFT_565795 [Immersiella caudata]|uniref:Ubiquitin-like domain-containing protein n=1 Tax=Immersiella caudata TaxID=314043 RepID=A0AA39WNX0_9PEZI|nr:hypothetical protein B0T14DRAFT_565795 [Immersiella caudata]
MASAGEIIAVLGLFERVILELRNYKDAPSHFQQLSIELDLLSSTLRHASQLRPSNDDERQTLDKIGAIAMHCLIPLQAMGDKMRSKEGSLGHFRTTRSLASIGTRLHWSMISRKDIDGLRTTILSEMLAINMLLSTQQLGQIKRLSSEVDRLGNTQSTLVNKHSSALLQQTSAIFTIVATTPKAIADLQLLTAEQGTKQSQEAQAVRSGLDSITKHMQALVIATNNSLATAQRHAASIGRAVKRLGALMRDIRELFVFLANCSKEILEAIGRNTLVLMHIASQMKRFLRAIDAIPLHLNVDIVRLDDALGDTWGLPLQACGSWPSFCNMLQHVVFAGRPGLDRVTTGQFAITLATSGARVDQYNWENFIKRDLHIQQAMVLSRANTGESHDTNECPFPRCDGKILDIDRPGTCPTCRRQASSQQEGGHFIKILGRIQGPKGGSHTLPVDDTAQSPTAPPQLPQMQRAEDLQHFRRIHISEPAKPIRNMDEALCRLAADSTDATANAFLGLHHIIEYGKDPQSFSGRLSNAKRHFQTAVKSDPSPAENWYLLACSKRPSNLDNLWSNVWMFHQHMDSLKGFARSIHLNRDLWENWYNLGVLYDSVHQPRDAVDAIDSCLELDPNLPSVQAGLRLLKQHMAESTHTPPEDYKILTMRDVNTVFHLKEYDEPRGEQFAIMPLVGSQPGPGLEYDTMSETSDESGWEISENESEDEMEFESTISSLKENTTP